eukprot:CAMPEP_0183346262 /NCGR_PEP_ID=MMETSP0164_2-20130417/11436_1 /TAXON_ID=221442 /ORGANISM="Coccolithus pelagicus ssp braarudi, Strain PLY182g" /LENGTH=227 /DNA_ID=CAMNT_0025517511 /DNA_START=1 /DNA_END=684 /DNA_ORIENTATION=+
MGSLRQRAWLALNLKGRSVGSALGSPRWDELLGTSLQPMGDAYGELVEVATDVPAAAADAASTAAAMGIDLGQRPPPTELATAVLDAQSAFYLALTSGDVPAMASLWEGAAPDPGVTDVLGAGGRLDPWSAQLREGARPSGLRATDSDALLLSATEAYTTAVERPEQGGTLLASQRWRRDPDAGGEWLLAAHRTIPWSADGGTAVATLRCDGRGCIALARDINTRSG